MKKKNKQSSGIPSPCISICEMDETTGYCRGCFRTLKEIADWDRAGDEARQKILDHLPARSDIQLD